MEAKGLIPFIVLLIAGVESAVHANTQPTQKIKEENVSYTVGNTNYKGYIVYDENIKEKRPAILVVHEWWGLNEYPKMRARQLAEMGYIAMAVDLFGQGKTATNPKEAQALTAPFYANPRLGKTLLDRAAAKLKEYPQADSSKIIAIGYCFGGSVVLNSAKLGSDFKAVASFHGGLKGVPPRKDLLKAKILVCHGAKDRFVPDKDVKEFKHQMDSIHADYKFIVYPNATHAFSNPASTENGKKFNMPIEYNKEAELKSWNDFKDFLKAIK
ncbi:MAG TPA: dienelactone hydrolase family protein [Paludibacter sp.]|nr:dienelactone hydrolase family protein [Paludibacter sp.]